MEMKLFVIFGALAIVAVLVLLACVAIKKGNKDVVFRMLYTLVCKAEEAFEGNGRGAEKKAWVVEKIHETLPGLAKVFISEKDIDTLLELAVQKMKELLAEAAE